MSHNAESDVPDHRRDESVPIEFIARVGPVARCICGRDYVGGYECQGAIEDRRTRVTPPGKGDQP